MIEYLIQNFSWASFSLALAFFLVVSSITQITVSLIKLRRAQKNVQKAGVELYRLREKYAKSRTGTADLLKRM